MFQKRCKKAVGQSNISPTLLREFPVVIPDKDIQQQYTKLAGKHSRLLFQQREALRQAEHLFQTLLHKAFRGELGAGDEHVVEILSTPLVNDTAEAKLVQARMGLE